jgi:lipopolysaccharide export system protein LptA
MLTVSVALAAETGSSKPPVAAASEPTTITAQKMTVRNQENKAYFDGAVVLSKGTLVVHSDSMVVSFKQKDAQGLAPKGAESASTPSAENPQKSKANATGMPASGSRAISMVEAIGHVRIEKEGGTATCQKAVYYEADEKIVLTGEPIAWQKGTRVTGKVITMYLGEDRSVVEGESRVMIEPEQAGGR